MVIWLEKSMASTFTCQKKPKGEKENNQLSPIGSSVSVPRNSSSGNLNVVFAKPVKSIDVSVHHIISL